MAVRLENSAHVLSGEKKCDGLRLWDLRWSIGRFVEGFDGNVGGFSGESEYQNPPQFPEIPLSSKSKVPQHQKIKL